MPASAEKARALQETLRGWREAIVDFACELVEAPTVNPPGDERQLAQLIAQRAQSLGLGQPDILAARPEHPNLLLVPRSREVPTDAGRQLACGTSVGTGFAALPMVLTSQFGAALSTESNDAALSRHYC